MTTYHCQCGQIYGDACGWSGPADEMVLIEWMPDYHRSSHAAAHGSGIYPANGAMRLAVQRECADRIEESEGDPESWPDGCTWFDRLAGDDDVADYAMTNMSTSSRLYRVRDAVYDQRTDAIADGWDGAEYGGWVPANGKIQGVKWGWIALSRYQED